MVRTADSHSANTGSIPVTADKTRDAFVVSLVLLCVAREFTPKGKAFFGFSEELAEAGADFGLCLEST